MKCVCLFDVKLIRRLTSDRFPAAKNVNRSIMDEHNYIMGLFVKLSNVELEADCSLFVYLFQ